MGKAVILCHVRVRGRCSMSVDWAKAIWQRTTETLSSCLMDMTPVYKGSRNNCHLHRMNKYNYLANFNNKQRFINTLSWFLQENNSLTYHA